MGIEGEAGSGSGVSDVVWTSPSSNSCSSAVTFLVEAFLEEGKVAEGLVTRADLELKLRVD